MSFTELMKNELNRAFTENGDVCFKSSGSYCLDLFGLAGAMRFNLNDAMSLFIKAFFENRVVAIKLLFYIRDIRGGLGERRMFRFFLNILGNFYPNIAKELLPYIPEYGRYDDLLVFLNTPVKENTIDLIKKQLEEDINNMNNGKNYSLLSKWLPSINTSNSEQRDLARTIADSLNMDYKTYRKTLASLRKNLIENNLRRRDYSFDYSKIPGRAFNKYTNCFMTNDNERFRKFMDSVRNCCSKSILHMDTLSPYEIVRKIRNDAKFEEVANTMWNEFVLESDNSKTLVVRDGSGSMYDYCNPQAIDVADAFTLLYTEKNTGLFHSKFLTFGSKPEFVELKSETLSDKLKELKAYDDCSNTNIEAVYNAIFNVYNSPKFTKEDELEKIIIISDMEFDWAMGVHYGSKNSETTFEQFRDKFNKAGFKMPKMVFINVRARSTHMPIKKDDENCTIISGSSTSVLNNVIKGENINPIDFMNECLVKYAFVEKLNLEVNND